MTWVNILDTESIVSGELVTGVRCADEKPDKCVSLLLTTGGWLPLLMLAISQPSLTTLDANSCFAW